MECRAPSVRTHLAVFVGLLALGCDKKEKPVGEAPPPVQLRSPCESIPEGGAQAAFGLPARAAGHCIDPTSDVRSYGTGAKAPLDAVCVELFNGECELYKSYGLDAVRTLRYAPLSSQTSSVSVVVSEFRSNQGAYGFFSRRILGGAPPSEKTVTPLVLAGQGALGTGVAYLQRGKAVVELTYLSETETPTEVAEKAAHLLPELASAISDSLGGPKAPPRVALVTQLAGAEELTTELPPDGLLGLVGTGPYAVTHYDGTDAAHRLVALEASDADGAGDALRLVRSAGSAHKLKFRDVYSVRVAREENAPEIWHFRVQGRLLLGVGPALGAQTKLLAAKQRERLEDDWAVFSLERLTEFSKHARRVSE